MIPEENLHFSGQFYIGQANFTPRSQYINEDTEFYLMLCTSLCIKIKILIKISITELLVLVKLVFLDDPVLWIKLSSPLCSPLFPAEFQVSKL